MERNLSFKRTAIPSFERLILSYNAAEFDSPFRSTVPLLSFVRDGKVMLHQIFTQCGMSAPIDLHFEFTIKPPKGRGKASYTDLLVESESRCLAVEAKWTEPMYALVSTWLKQTGTSNYQDQVNRKALPSGWRTLIRSRAGRDLVAKDFADGIYQIVHRAASACYYETKQPLLAYFKFSPSPDPNGATYTDYKGALKILHKILGNPADFPFFLVDIEMSPTKAFYAIESLPKGERATSVLVRDALTQSRLFEFQDYRIDRIGNA